MFHRLNKYHIARSSNSELDMSIVNDRLLAKASGPNGIDGEMAMAHVWLEFGDARAMAKWILENTEE